MVKGWYTGLNISAGGHKPDMRAAIVLQRDDVHHTELKQEHIRSGFMPRSFSMSPTLNSLHNIVKH
jgi:hypothetical protein